MPGSNITQGGLHFQLVVPKLWDPIGLSYVTEEVTSGGESGGDVSVIASVLPTGASTAAKQDLLLTELQLKADLTETQPVSVASLPLPTGAATSAKQDTLLTELQLKADLSETQPVSVASLPLPSGAATSAKQDTGNTSIASVDSKTPALGQALAAASTPVVLTAAQVTTLTPPAAITNYAAETGGNLAAILAKIIVSPATEATLAAILAKILAAPATEAKQDTGNTSLSTIAGKDFATQTTLAAILAKILVAPATEAKQDTGNTSLATIAGKDFATQTTLAALLAELTQKTEPADQQHTIVDSMPAVSANTAADVLLADDDAGYVDGQLAKNATQTPDGRLRTLVAGVVSDTPVSQLDGANRALSLTADGRLRVSSEPAVARYDFWGDLTNNYVAADAGPTFYRSLQPLHAFS